MSVKRVLRVHTADTWLPVIVVYICLYGSFSAYPTIFSSHGLSTSTIGLTFLPVMVGFFVLLAVQILHYKRYLNLNRDAKKGVQRRGIHNGKIEPEERLVPCESIRVPS